MRQILTRAALAALVAAGSSVPAMADEPVENDFIRDQVFDAKSLPELVKNPTFMTLRLDKAEVREVIKLVAQKGGMNLIMDDSVQGRFSIDVRAMPLDEFFSLVMNMNGLGARRIGTALMIAKASTLKAKMEATQTATFRLNNATATEALKLLEKLLNIQAARQGAQAAGGTGANAAENRVAALQSMLMLDADKRTNSILATGTAADIERVRNTIKVLDVPAPQVVIEVKLVEVQSSLAKRLGGEFGFGGSKLGVSNNVSDPSVTSNGAPTAGNPSAPGGTAITFSAMGNFTSNLNARINALVQNGEAKVLANPRVATQDSYEATIKIVNKFPVVSVNFQGGQAGAPALAAENVEFREIGETLTITPRIDTNGFVTMDLEPVISVRGKDVIVNRNPVPEINERRLKTKMRVRDGETVVIGGLIRRNTNGSTTKMPILGDLPIIGFMFRQETNDFTENEIIIMVTPHITTEKSNI